MGTTGVPQADRTVERFERFSRAVFADREVQVRLRSVSEWPAFVDAAVAAAHECGVELTEGDLAAARDEARRSWRERWV